MLHHADGEIVLCEIDGATATLILNRPDKLNAINYHMADRLIALLDQIEVDPAIRAVILTGSGDRAFSAGADIHEFSETVKGGVEAVVNAFVRRGQAMTARIEGFSKPVIAAVNGIAFGGGCEIVEATHLAIASESAAFAKPEINIGIVPTFGGTQRLPRLAGRKRALEHLLTGDPFTPERASAIGLVNQVVAPQDLLPTARALAQRITRHSRVTVAGVLTAVTRGINLSIDEGLQVEREQFARLAPTHDLSEGLQAWKERRTPAYSGAW